MLDEESASQSHNNRLQRTVVRRRNRIFGGHTQ
jgi:hypothetical protein